MDFDIIKAKKVLIHAVMEAEVKSIISCVPPAGPFRSVCWALEYPECPHEGRLYTQHSTEHGCAIRASMIVDGTDREVSDFLFSGSKSECIAWLEDAAHEELLIEIYDHLAEKADSML